MERNKGCNLAGGGDNGTGDNALNYTGVSPGATQVVNTAIYLLSDLHHAIDAEFQSFLAECPPQGNFARGVHLLQGQRLETYKSKLGESARQLATNQNALLALLNQCERCEKASHKLSADQICEAVHSLESAVSTLSLFALSGCMETEDSQIDCCESHPNAPVGRVMACDDRTLLCKDVLDKLRLLHRSLLSHIVTAGSDPLTS